MNPTNKDLNKLAEVASQLNTETDDLNRLIISLEERLAGMQIGLECWCGLTIEPVERFGENYETDEKDKFRESWNLGYCKIGDAWRIAIRREIDDYAPPYDQWDFAGVVTATLTSLANAPRHLRISFAEHLDTLISSLTELAERRVEEMQKAKKELASES
ncbi:MAG: hypothetical protein IID08_10755 [Candidatus Hydrogenedentes bacterium]|nr:hypothetical protein [Candidatus Hydrogenedentota bacterium]